MTHATRFCAQYEVRALNTNHAVYQKKISQKDGLNVTQVSLQVFSHWFCFPSVENKNQVSVPYRTFYTADPPKPGVREITARFLGLRLSVVRGEIGRVANIRPGVQPVVRADSDGHKAKRHESTHGGQEQLNRTVAPSHRAS